MADKIVRLDPYWYNEEDCLGAGSFGEVYKGHTDKNKTLHLAIKRIRKGKLPQHVIDQEIQILQELSRPDVKNAHFVTLIESVQTEKYVHLIMEFCNGGDLDHYLKEKKKMDEPSLRIFLQQIASALKILHDRDIIHRDLKPANILLTHNGLKDVSHTTFKIADFGLGRFLDEGAKAGTVCGTLAYMAPEILVPNARYDYKVDLYSIGAIVYQCFTGILFSHPPTKLPSNMSSELSDLIARLLRKDPRDRISFNDFYNHAFIGLKKVVELQKKTTPAATPAPAPISRPQTPIGINCDIKVKIVGDEKASPFRPATPKQVFLPKDQACAAQNPPQKTVQQRAVEATPKYPFPPAAKDVKVNILGNGKAEPPHQATPKQVFLQKGQGDGDAGKVPVAKDARGATPAPTPPRKTGAFCACLRANSPPLNAVQEVVSTKLKTLIFTNRDVYGIAHLDMKFYVLCRSPNAIVPFWDQSPFSKSVDFDVTEHIKFPQDIASSEASKCLYVTDTGNNCVWKVEGTYTFKISRWVSDIGSPHTLSVGPEGRVVTFGNKSKTLDVYGPDAVLVHRVPLPGEVKAPQHAVETSRGSYIVSYGDHLTSKKQGICEVTVKGKVTRRYEDKTTGQLNHPTHLAIDSDDAVFVSDHANSRVLRLDGQLRLEQVLPSDERDNLDKPFRLCLKSIRGQSRLLVEHRINAVDIYSLTR